MESISSSPAQRSSSRLVEFWLAFRRSKMGIIGLVMLASMILVAVFAPVLAPYEPSSTENVETSDIYNPPSSAHWFGTDDKGGDVFSNSIYGARVSLTVGFFAAFISIIV